MLGLARLHTCARIHGTMRSTSSRSRLVRLFDRREFLSTSRDKTNSQETAAAAPVKPLLLPFTAPSPSELVAVLFVETFKLQSRRLLH